MSKKKAPAKKKVVTVANKPKKNIKPTVSRTKVAQKVASQPIIFGKTNYIYMAAGVLVMILGFVAMSGGGMDDPNVWDESVIYGFRRITLAPILILGGLILQIFAIFKKA